MELFLQPTPASCSTVFSRPIHPLEVFPSPSSQCSRRRDAHTLPLDSPFFQPNPTLFPSTNLHPYSLVRLDSSTVYPSPRGWSGDRKANTTQLYAPCSPQRSISPNPPTLVREDCSDGVGTQNTNLSNCSSVPARRKRTVHACSKCRERKSKCSGDRPVCQRCSLRGLLCTYREHDKPRVRGPNKTRLRATSSSVELRKDIIISEGSGESTNRPAREYGTFPRSKTPHSIYSDVRNYASLDPSQPSSLAASAIASEAQSPLTSLPGSRRPSLSSQMAMLTDGQFDEGLNPHPSPPNFVPAPSAYDVDLNDIDGYNSYSGPLATASSFSCSSASSHEDGASDPRIYDLETALAAMADAASTPSNHDSSPSETPSPSYHESAAPSPESVMLCLPMRLGQIQADLSTYTYIADENSVDLSIPRVYSTGQITDSLLPIYQNACVEHSSLSQPSSGYGAALPSMPQPPNLMVQLCDEHITSFDQVAAFTQNIF